LADLCHKFLSRKLHWSFVTLIFHGLPSLWIQICPIRSSDQSVFHFCKHNFAHFSLFVLKIWDRYVSPFFKLKTVILWQWREAMFCRFYFWVQQISYIASEYLDLKPGVYIVCRNSLTPAQYGYKKTLYPDFIFDCFCFHEAFI